MSVFMGRPIYSLVGVKRSPPFFHDGWAFFDFSTFGDQLHLFFPLGLFLFSLIWDLSRLNLRSGPRRCS